MLTRELAIAEYKQGQVFPDRLTQAKHAQYHAYAAEMLEIYRTGIGLTRKELHGSVRRLFANESECPPRRMDSFCKLLDEVSTYARDKPGKAAKLRQRVFRAAAKLHPLVRATDKWFEHDEETAKKQVAEEIGLPWKTIDKLLFADLIEYHRLESFAGYDEPSKLLSRYNVAQSQAVLYDAASMTVLTTDDFKSVVRFAKLAGLMHTIEQLGENSYRFRFDGAASIFGATHRYGVAMARFLPGLLSCRGWEMVAWLKPTSWGQRLQFKLDDRCGLKSPVAPPAEFDSEVEQRFFTQWNEEPRGEWRLERERRVLHSRQRVFVPDFEFIHSDGRKVLMEVVGFWTPEYLTHKIETLQMFQHERILLAVQESIASKLPSELGTVVPYKKSLPVSEVLDRLDKIRAAE